MLDGVEFSVLMAETVATWCAIVFWPLPIFGPFGPFPEPRRYTDAEYAELDEQLEGLCGHLNDPEHCIPCRPDAEDYCIFFCPYCKSGTWHDPRGECCRCKNVALVVFAQGFPLTT